MIGLIQKVCKELFFEIIFFYLEREDEQCFENINFAVFGLGNKTYENYNTMGKYFDKRLSQLGGNRLLDLGLGDDDGK